MKLNCESETDFDVCQGLRLGTILNMVVNRAGHSPTRNHVSRILPVPPVSAFEVLSERLYVVVAGCPWAFGGWMTMPVVDEPGTPEGILPLLSVTADARPRPHSRSRAAESAMSWSRDGDRPSAVFGQSAGLSCELTC